MKVCFVYPDVGGVQCYGARKYHHGLGYLSAVLKQAGHSTSLVYLDAHPTREQFLTDVLKPAPDLVAFACTTHQHSVAELCAGWLKAAAPDVFTLAGGVHVTLAPQEVARCQAFDALCLGEGEQPLLELVESRALGQSRGDIRNLWLRQAGDWQRNPLRPLIANLDDLPFPDRELFDSDVLLRENGGRLDLMIGRGCPYGCTYCCNPGLRARYRGLGSYVRWRSPANVLAEIEELAQRYPLRVLNFQDDVFTLDRAWTLAFCEGYAERFDIPFWVNTRVDLLNEPIVAALAGAGCQGVRIGIESGNEELRRAVLGRRMTNEQIRDAFKLLRRHHMHIHTCNMIGLPGETPDNVDETIQLNRELAPEHLQFSVFYPYPLTELYDRAIAQGMLEPAHTLAGYYGRESVLHLPTMTPAQLAQKYDHFAALKAELLAHHSHSWYHRLRRHLAALVRGDERLLDIALGLLRRHGARLHVAVMLLGALSILVVQGDTESAWTLSHTMTSIGDGWATSAT